MIGQNSTNRIDETDYGKHLTNKFAQYDLELNKTP